jgi:hypothetical protein
VGRRDQGARLAVKRKAPLKRTRLDRGTKPIKRVSAKKAKASSAEAKVKKRVLARDGGCVARRFQGLDFGRVVVPACFGGLEKHELVKRSHWTSGALDENNCVILCHGHNRWVEDWPVEAAELGLVIGGGPPDRGAGEDSVRDG